MAKTGFIIVLMRTEASETGHELRKPLNSLQEDHLLVTHFIINLFFFFSFFMPFSLFLSYFLHFCPSQPKGRTFTLPFYCRRFQPHCDKHFFKRNLPLPSEVASRAFPALKAALYFILSRRNRMPARSPAAPSATQIPAPYANTSRSTRPKSNRCAER